MSKIYFLICRDITWPQTTENLNTFLAGRPVVYSTQQILFEDRRGMMVMS